MGDGGVVEEGRSVVVRGEEVGLCGWCGRLLLLIAVFLLLAALCLLPVSSAVSKAFLGFCERWWGLWAVDWCLDS